MPLKLLKNILFFRKQKLWGLGETIPLKARTELMKCIPKKKNQDY